MKHWKDMTLLLPNCGMWQARYTTDEHISLYRQSNSMFEAMLYNK